MEAIQRDNKQLEIYPSIIDPLINEYWRLAF